jgi:signal recognition particle subunit SEC65
MLTRAQIDKYITQIPAGIDPDDRRAAYSVITGFGDGKSIGEISSYYAISKEVVDTWMVYFDLSSTKSHSKGKRTSKTKIIEEYLAKNVGKTINFAKVAEELKISVPTVYNFHRDNRSYFKKVERGSFQIIDPKVERAKQ